MKLLVLGGTGRLGRQVVDVAIARGHMVTAFLRAPQALAPRNSLHVVGGSPLDHHALQSAMQGHDAVVSSLGTHAPWRAMAPSMAELVATVVTTMAASGPERLVAISGAMLFREMGLPAAILRLILRSHARDLASMEAVVTASSLEWTLVRPPRLMDGSSDDYRATAGAFPPGGRPAVTFRAVAAFMIDALERRRHVREIVGLAR
jgi:putative NADH-flavin reductase